MHPYIEQRIVPEHIVLVSLWNTLMLSNVLAVSPHFMSVLKHTCFYSLDVAYVNS